MQPAVSRIHALKYGTLTKQKAKYEYLTGQKDTKDMKFPGEIDLEIKCKNPCKTAITESVISEHFYSIKDY